MRSSRRDRKSGRELSVMRSQGYIEIESSSSDSEDDREVAATASSAAFSGTDGRDSQSIQDLSHFFLGVVVRRCRGIFGANS